jgi:hypothetical protein
MQPLKDYLAASGHTAETFARMIAVGTDDLHRFLSGEGAPDRRVAQRIVDMTDGALTLDDLAAAPGIIDFNARAAAASAEIDQGALEHVLADILPALVGGAKRKGDEQLPRLAADAVASAYAALSSVTTRRNADRLVQALLPVFSEILEEMSAHPSRRDEAGPLAREAAARYLQTAPPRR